MTRPSGLTLDAGALIAVERGDRRLRVLLDEVVTSDPGDFMVLDAQLPVIVV